MQCVLMQIHFLCVQLYFDGVSLCANLLHTNVEPCIWLGLGTPKPQQPTWDQVQSLKNSVYKSGKEESLRDRCTRFSGSKD